MHFEDHQRWQMQNHIYARKIVIFSTSLKLYDIQKQLHPGNQAEEITSVYHRWERDILLSSQISPNEVDSTGMKCQVISSWTLIKLILQISSTEPGGWSEGKGAQTYSNVAQCQGQETLPLLEDFKGKACRSFLWTCRHCGFIHSYRWKRQDSPRGRTLGKSKARAEVRAFCTDGHLHSKENNPWERISFDLFQHEG